MKTIDLRPLISAEATIDQSKKEISITSKQEISYPILMLVVMGARNSVGGDPLIGYAIYINGEYVTKIKG